MNLLNTSCRPINKTTLKTTMLKNVRFGAVILCGLLFCTIISQLGSAMAVTESSKTLRHVVQFQFKSDSSSDSVQSVVDAFRALPSKIAEIADFEYGTNNSPEGLAQGFTHCFLVTFKSEKDRDIYIKHPAHEAFVSVLKPHLEKVQVIDFWSAK